MSRHPLADSFEVLVVDDDAGIRDLIGDYFDEQGFKVSRAADGRAAVATLQRHPSRFGLVVTDLCLPDVDGFGVLFEARRANPRSYVVIVTGYASLDSAIQAVRSGAYDYLPKPFALGQLDVILRRIADHASLERAARDAGAWPTPQPGLSRTLPIVTAPVERALPPARPSVCDDTTDDRLRAIERAIERIERRVEALTEPPYRQ